MRRLLTAVVIAAAIVAGVSGNASAQLRGHYIAGFTGLDNGSQPLPSISLGLPVYFYPTDTIKNDTGHTIGNNPQIRASFTGGSVLWVTNVKVLGANLGGEVVPADFMKSRIETNTLEVPGSFGFSDIWVEPVSLGWHKPRADFTAGWSFFAPSGEWELGGRDNSGLGMWSNDFQGGATLHLDDKHVWTTALLATYEIHSHKEDTDIKVGDILTVEGGTGKAFYKKLSDEALPRVIHLGVVYYTQLKVTSDAAGALANEVFARDKDRVFAVGGEANIFLPKPKLLLGARVLPEFGARNRTQGLTCLFTVGYQARSLMKAAAQP